MNKLARSDILKVKPYEPGKPIEEVQRELGLKTVIKLASNENPLGPSPKAVEAIRRALSNLNRYPDGNCFYLKQKLASRLKVKPQNLIIGNGSDELIVLAIRAFVNKGEEVIISRPTFLVYEIASRVVGAKITFVPLKNFRYDLPSIKKKITPRTKMVFIANPDNPTGSYVNKREVDTFLKGLPKSVIIYFDEAYAEVVGERDYPETLKYLGRKNIVIARSFSKAYGLAGLRIGYAVAKPEVINYMNRVREPFNVNSLAQVAARAALDDKLFLKRTRSLLKKEKKYLYSNFKRLGFKYIPSATNFILVDTGKNSSGIFKRLLKLGIIVREMKAWKLNTFIRVTIGTKGENRKFIKALEKIMSTSERRKR